MKIYAVEVIDITNEEINNLCESFDSVKKLKVERMFNKLDKIRTILGEILIRVILIEEQNIRNRDIVFFTNHFGKPFVSGCCDFFFNISHSGNFVICAIDNQSIGIDIEKIKYIEYEELSKKFFTENEHNYILNTQDKKNQLDRFYKLWTLKESYMKYFGQGLNIELNSFSIDINKNSEIKVIVNGQYDDSYFSVLNIDSNYAAALCTKEKKIYDNIEKIDQIYLINKYLKYSLNQIEEVI